MQHSFRVIAKLQSHMALRARSVDFKRGVYIRTYLLAARSPRLETRNINSQRDMAWSRQIHRFQV
jgi:hypothetical protein